MTNPNSPLTSDHLSQINSGLALLDQAESQAMLARQAGIDVSAAEQVLKDTRTKLMALKRVYFPNSV